MRMVDLIAKKRDGAELSKEEIEFIVEGYTRGDIPDYQMSAWAMAVFFRGMTPAETAHLTMAMARSGDLADLSRIRGVKVDKHSTGGVGDKTTLVVAPLVAAAGVPVAKMSGRGLGHTGGTIDKLESIPGLTTELSPDEFVDQVNRIGIAVVGQTGNLTPADKKLYSLRDVTATVNSVPLIASSVMSKKIAAGADAIVLDVKAGSGAFMKNVGEAWKLASTMVDIGRSLGRRTVAVISNMDQPLGLAVGNALEVREAVDALRGEGPEDLTRLALTLGAHMVVLGGKADSFKEAYEKLEKILQSGEALEKFRQFVAAQGGNPDVADRPADLLPKAPYRITVPSPADGFVHAIQAEEIGLAAMTLGAGRATKESSIDPAVGVVLAKKVGDPVRRGEILAILHAGREDVTHIRQRVERAFDIRPERRKKPRLIHGVVE
ncbi:MAG TPA: pyrimidine-nucleoside phosphorylase [Paenibacillaceae bacterium]